MEAPEAAELALVETVSEKAPVVDAVRVACAEALLLPDCWEDTEPVVESEGAPVALEVSETAADGLELPLAVPHCDAERVVVAMADPDAVVDASALALDVTVGAADALALPVTREEAVTVPPLLTVRVADGESEGCAVNVSATVAEGVPLPERLLRPLSDELDDRVLCADAVCVPVGLRDTRAEFVGEGDGRGDRDEDTLPDELGERLGDVVALLLPGADLDTCGDRDDDALHVSTALEETMALELASRVD